jgi:LysM repeat protein
MHRDSPKSAARVLAPLALALCTLAFLYVIFSSGTGGGGGATGQGTTRAVGGKQAQTTAGSVPSKPTYTVKTGDTLGGIAAKTGVSVQKLQELNPGLDPQGLVSGQKIKLRE